MACPLRDILNPTDDDPGRRPSTSEPEQSGTLITPPESQEDSHPTVSASTSFTSIDTTTTLALTDPTSTNRLKRRRSTFQGPPYSHLFLPALPVRHKRSRLTPTTPSFPLSQLTLASPTSTSHQPPATAEPTRPPGPFNLLTSLLDHPELSLALAAALPVPALLSLYTLSRPFHARLNAHTTTYVLASARRWAPLAAELFPFKAYSPLCVRDPEWRVSEERPDEPRTVPGLRWLQMVAFRETVMREVVGLLAREGHVLPPGGEAERVVGKTWAVMDCASNGGRIGLVHNREYWSDRELFVATMWFVKLDMRFSDPVDGEGEVGLRRLLLGQRSLSTLWRVLKREELTTRLELLQMYVRYSYRPANPAHEGMSVLGVPAHEVGMLCREGWGRGTERLLRPDELIMREGVRRGLDLHETYLDCVLYGYIDPETFEDIHVPKLLAVEGGVDGAEQGAGDGSPAAIGNGEGEAETDEQAE